MLFCAVLLTASLYTIAQNGNGLGFEKGKKLEMTVTVNSSMASMGNTTLAAVIERSFDVEDVLNGNAVIEHKIKRVKFDMQSMMGNESFDSEKDSDMKGQTGKALEKTLKSKYSMTLDGSGRVVAVTMDDDFKKAQEQEATDMMAGMIGQLSDGFKAPAIGDKSIFSILPAKEITKGEKWTDTIPGGMVHYTVEEITEDAITLSYVEEVKLESTQEMMGQELKMVTNDKTTGTVILDGRTRLLREKSGSSEATGTIEVMGQQMPISTSSTKKWTVK